MRTGLAGLTLLVATAAAVASAVALLRERSEPLGLEARLQALETRVERLARSFHDGEAQAARGPSLAGREEPVPSSAAAPANRGAAPPTDPADEAAAAPGTEPAATSPEAIESLVEQVVERKAARFQLMQGNKKPSLDLFAQTLSLSEDQRRAAEQAVLASQREIQAILETPGRDGTNFVDELVEVLADGLAQPGKDPTRAQRLFGRLLTETLPGSDDTYAVRVEAVKGRLREGFRRDWDAAQYAAFEAWQMDPTEIQEIEGSPWKELEARVIERARALGADLPPAATR